MGPGVRRRYLENDTKLHVYLRCIGNDEERHVSLSSGQFIVLRADLACDGSAHNKIMYHMHCVVTIRRIEREHGVSEEVAWQTFLCHYCAEKCFSWQPLPNHTTKRKAKPAGVAEEKQEIPNTEMMTTASIAQDVNNTRAQFWNYGCVTVALNVPEATCKNAVSEVSGDENGVDFGDAFLRMLTLLL